MKIGVTGHQVIPGHALAFVTTGIENLINDVEVGLVGVSCLAAGADQLFASLVLEHSGCLHVILPSQGYEKTFSRSQDLRRFQVLLKSATVIETLTFQKPSEEAFLVAGCRVVDDSDLLLAIWDGRPARGKGGTADIVAYARERGIQVEIIWPPGIPRQ